jgi:hypothetical protein
MHFGKTIDIDVRNDDLYALVQESFSAGSADAARRTGDDGDLAGYTIDPTGNYPDSLYQTSNEPFHSSKLMHRAGDGNGLGSVQLRHLVFMNGRFAPAAVIRALAKFYYWGRGVFGKTRADYQPSHETQSRYRRAFCAGGRIPCAS